MKDVPLTALLEDSWPSVQRFSQFQLVSTAPCQGIGFLGTCPLHQPAGMTRNKKDAY